MTLILQTMLRYFTIISVVMCYCAVSHAQDEKTRLVQRIAAAQGLTEMFEQMIVQQKQLARQNADRLLEEATQQGRTVPTEKVQAALTRLLDRIANIITPDEIVQAWATEYAKELSIQELDGILQYYESPVGRKDVAASKAALWRFTEWCAQRSQERIRPILADFSSELVAARQ